MNNEIKKPTDEWHYLEVNRGRYLCPRHGGFCDSCDGYAMNCPICGKSESKKNKENWQINPVNRALEIIRGLQKRSLNRFSILSGITGLFGVFSLFQTDAFLKYWQDLGCWSQTLLMLFSICFFISFICYLTSMAHVKITCREKICGFFGTAKFLKKTIDDWETYMVCCLNAFELCHEIGNKILVLGGVFIIIVLIIQLF